ncbi:hypothetical protein BDW62DRAFT_183903 [Aspergillus aurantiobrunneus]
MLGVIATELHDRGAICLFNNSSTLIPRFASTIHLCRLHPPRLWFLCKSPTLQQCRSIVGIDSFSSTDGRSSGPPDHRPTIEPSKIPSLEGPDCRAPLNSTDSQPKEDYQAMDWVWSGCGLGWRRICQISPGRSDSFAQNIGRLNFQSDNSRRESLLLI